MISGPPALYRVRPGPVPPQHFPMDALPVKTVIAALRTDLALPLTWPQTSQRLLRFFIFVAFSRIRRVEVASMLNRWPLVLCSLEYLGRLFRLIDSI